MSEKRRHTETTARAFDDSSGVLYPIQFLQIGTLPDVPAPLVRITTCGRFKLEVLYEVMRTTPPQGRYREVRRENGPKSSGTALTLLKMLASQPGHTAARDWLSEHLGPTKSVEEDDDELWGRGMVQVDNIVGLLRGLLCPSWIAEHDRGALRKLLVNMLRNHQESGTGYALASAPLIWLDTDELAASIQLACLREERGKDALPYWEQAYMLAAQGPFLPNEPYSDWATDKRVEIDGYLRQSVHRLRHLLLLRYGQASEHRVIFLLRQYWQRHITDEEALRHLMELLSKHGSLQEAQQYYQRLCESLQEEGDKPDQRTQDAAQNLVRFEQSINGHSKEKIRLLPKSAIPSSSLCRDRDNLSMKQSFNSTFLNSMGIPIESSSFLRTDIDILTHLSILLHKTSVVSEGEIGYFDQQTRLYWHAREETALPATTLYTYVIRHLDDITLLLARSHLPMLRSYLCEITCRTVLLAGILLYDMGQYIQARQQYLLVFQAAKEANNPVLQDRIYQGSGDKTSSGSPWHAR